MHRFFDRAEFAGHSRSSTRPAMLPSATRNDVGTPNPLISRLNSQACTHPCQRFAHVLTNAHA